MICIIYNLYEYKLGQYTYSWPLTAYWRTLVCVNHITSKIRTKKQTTWPSHEPNQNKESKKRKRAVHNTTRKQLTLSAMELAPPMTCWRALQFNTLPRRISGVAGCLWYCQKWVYIKTSNHFIKSLMKSLQLNKKSLAVLTPPLIAVNNSHYWLLSLIAVVTFCLDQSVTTAEFP